MDHDQKELIEQVKTVFMEQIPFNKYLGMKIESLSQDCASVRIDMRIDYLRPGRGKYFKATGTVLRTGNKVAVTRMELHNDQELLIAVGTGTYVVV